MQQQQQNQQQIRHCFHVGHHPSSGESIGNYDGPEITSKDMLKAMAAYIWPKDDALVRKRLENFENTILKQYFL